MAVNPTPELPPAGIGGTIQAVYGSHGLDSFQRLLDDNPDWPIDEAANRFRQNPTLSRTYFFRTPSVRAVGEVIVPQLVEAAPGQPVSILEVGCSTGQESYSLAAAILANGNSDFHITAVDANPDNLRIARAGEYVWTPRSRQSVVAKIPRPYMDERFFGGQVEQALRPRTGLGNVSFEIWAKPLLKSKIDFVQGDILDGPAAGQFDMAITSNVLQHYPDRTKAKMLGNVLASLRAGGVFVVEPPPQSDRPDKQQYITDYEAWLGAAVVSAGLRPFAGDSSGTLYTKPSSPTMET